MHRLQLMSWRRWGKNKPITLKNLEKICNALECTPNDVFSFKEGGNE